MCLLSMKPSSFQDFEECSVITALLSTLRTYVCIYVPWEPCLTLEGILNPGDHNYPWGPQTFLGTTIIPGGHNHSLGPQLSLGATIIPGDHNYPWGHFLLYNGQTHARTYVHIRNTILLRTYMYVCMHGMIGSIAGSGCCVLSLLNHYVGPL